MGRLLRGVVAIKVNYELWFGPVSPSREIRVDPSRMVPIYTAAARFSSGSAVNGTALKTPPTAL
jgi:hypothetical protein